MGKTDGIEEDEEHRHIDNRGTPGSLARVFWPDRMFEKARTWLLRGD